MSYDVFVPVTERNLPILPVVIRSIRERIDCEDVLLVGNSSIENEIKGLACSFINEDGLFEYLDYKRIRALLTNRDRYAGKRTGWYLQQFLKMAYAKKCRNEEYLVWDADTIPLKRLGMHDSKGIPFFDVKDEYHWPYFSTMKRIFGKRVKWPGCSFISEHMIINTYYMNELLELIMRNESLNGDLFFEKILSAVRDTDLMGSGFSEFETYGNYVMMAHPASYKIRRIKGYRDSGLYAQNENEVKRIIDNLDHDYDILTIENRYRKGN